MQALLRAASGTCFNKSALNCTSVHQQGPDAARPGVALAQKSYDTHESSEKAALKELLEIGSLTVRDGVILDRDAKAPKVRKISGLGAVDAITANAFAALK